MKDIIQKLKGINVQISGYTIVEVVVVMALSTAVFATSVAVFNGKNNTALFSQANQDLASKVQNFASQITNGVPPDMSYINTTTGSKTSVYCSIQAGRAIFISTPPANTYCLYLGRALYISPLPGATSITAYSIMGDRYVGGCCGTTLAQSFDQTSPTTARACIGASCDTFDVFQDRYSLNNSLQIISSSIVPAGGGSATPGYGLIGLYVDMAGNSAPDTSGTSSLFTRAYPYTGSAANVVDCIQGTSGFCTNTATLVNNFSQWQLCLQNSSNTSQRAQLNVNSTAGGLTTQIIQPSNCS
jgi:hypothetical protein